MKLTHYRYNAFIIEAGEKRIAIDTGALFFYFLRLLTLIPKFEWASLTHIFVTHADPDHYWYADEAAGIKTVHGKLLLKIGPFSRTVEPGPDERVGGCAIGFSIRVGSPKPDFTPGRIGSTE